MKLLINLALRNLFRQKRRNILLGIAIALGIVILVIADSFSHGISDNLFNKVLRWAAGQVTVNFNEKGKLTRQIFRDRERVFALLKDIPGVEEKNEGLGMFCRAIGNGRADNVILVGADTTQNISKERRKELEESFRIIDGSWKDLEDHNIENPAIVSEEKARYLNVKKNDMIRLRFRNMFGQDQAVRVTVAGIMKNDNIFMQPVLFLEFDRAKELLGYRPYESGNIQLVVKDPQKNAKKIADIIHSRLEPGLAAIYASVKHGDRQKNATILGYKSDDESIKKFTDMLKLESGSLQTAALSQDGIILSRPMARALNAAAGDTVRVSYARKFEAGNTELTYKVSAVIAQTGGLSDDVILLNDEKFYDTYYQNLPKSTENDPSVSAPKRDSPWYSILAPEWILLKRTANTDEALKKYRELNKKTWKGTVVDVQTMYETASDILKLEGVLNLITLSAVMVLFFIILVGVVNTLRMTIRERTREIGTIRAIGMQKNDVRNTFILETFFLALFSSITGVAAAFGVMWLLSRITFNMSDNPMGMLLVNSRLYFLPTFWGIAGNVLLILMIAVVTAYFPAKRAANLSPAKALGHFE
jgi:ABC-type lipoprotein release transport system permease subunit